MRAEIVSLFSAFIPLGDYLPEQHITLRRTLAASPALQGQSRSGDCDDNFYNLLIAFQIAVRLDYLIEGKCLCNNWRQSAVAQTFFDKQSRTLESLRVA